MMATALYSLSADVLGNICGRLSALELSNLYGTLHRRLQSLLLSAGVITQLWFVDPMQDNSPETYFLNEIQKGSSTIKSIFISRFFVVSHDLFVLFARFRDLESISFAQVISCEPKKPCVDDDTFEMSRMEVHPLQRYRRKSPSKNMFPIVFIINPDEESPTGYHLPKFDIIFPHLRRFAISTSLLELLPTESNDSDPSWTIYAFDYLFKHQLSHIEALQIKYLEIPAKEFSFTLPPGLTDLYLSLKSKYNCGRMIEFPPTLEKLRLTKTRHVYAGSGPYIIFDHLFTSALPPLTRLILNGISCQLYQNDYNAPTTYVKLPTSLVHLEIDSPEQIEDTLRLLAPLPNLTMLKFDLEQSTTTTPIDWNRYCPNLKTLQLEQLQSSHIPTNLSFLRLNNVAISDIKQLLEQQSVCTNNNKTNIFVNNLLITSEDWSSLFLQYYQISDGKFNRKLFEGYIDKFMGTLKLVFRNLIMKEGDSFPIPVSVQSLNPTEFGIKLSQISSCANLKSIKIGSLTDCESEILKNESDLVKDVLGLESAPNLTQIDIVWSKRHNISLFKIDWSKLPALTSLSLPKSRWNFQQLSEVPRTIKYLRIQRINHVTDSELLLFLRKRPLTEFDFQFSGCDLVITGQLLPTTITSIETNSLFENSVQQLVAHLKTTKEAKINWQQFCRIPLEIPSSHLRSIEVDFKVLKLAESKRDKNRDSEVKYFQFSEPITLLESLNLGIWGEEPTIDFPAKHITINCNGTIESYFPRTLHYVESLTVTRWSQWAQLDNLFPNLKLLRIMRPQMCDYETERVFIRHLKMIEYDDIGLTGFSVRYKMPEVTWKSLVQATNRSLSKQSVTARRFYLPHWGAMFLPGSAKVIKLTLPPGFGSKQLLEFEEKDKHGNSLPPLNYAGSLSIPFIKTSFQCLRRLTHLEIHFTYKLYLRAWLKIRLPESLVTLILVGSSNSNARGDPYDHDSNSDEEKEAHTFDARKLSELETLSVPHCEESSLTLLAPNSLNYLDLGNAIDLTGSSFIRNKPAYLVCANLDQVNAWIGTNPVTFKTCLDGSPL
jgi:hypothetical protein